MSTLARTSLAALASLTLALAPACTCTCEDDNGTPTTDPPVLEASGPTGSPRVGENATLTCTSDKPVEWSVEGRPFGWTTESLSPTKITLRGTLPVGSASPGLDITFTATPTDDAPPTSITHSIRARPLVVQTRATLDHEGFGVLGYTITLRGSTPPWPPDAPGRVIINTDTQGLAPRTNVPNPIEAARIIVRDDDDLSITRAATVTGACSQPGHQSYERFTLSAPQGPDMLADAQFTVILHHHNQRCDKPYKLLNTTLTFE